MKPRSVPRGFYLAGSFAILFLLLPVLATLLSTSPPALYATAQDAEFLRALSNTFQSAGLATGLGILLGVPLAHLLANNRFPGRGWIEALITLPILLPHTAAGVALLMVFGREGWLGRPLAWLGLFFTDRMAGITVAMLFVGLPFLVHAMRDAFSLLDPELERSAQVDGASAWQIFYFITLPQTWRALLSGGVMMWARGISEFGAVVILAYHPKVLPTLVFERFAGYGLNAAQPITLLLIILAFLLLGLLRGLARRT